MEDSVEEIKELGDVKCPNCDALVTVKRRIRYNQPDPRHKVSEELYAEESVQTTLTNPKPKGKKRAGSEE
jgi:DNA-directed RNA polymerase subunit RPC12/RpoP